MKNYRFEYFLNAIHYCIYKGEVWSNSIIEKQVYIVVGILSAIFCFKKKYEKRVKELHNDKEVQEYFYGKKSGQAIGLAHHLFGFFYSAYPAFFSWIIVGIADSVYGELSKLYFVLLFGIPIGICFIPAYRAVFTDDKYLKYFKQFEKKDNIWHKKWKIITAVFCVGAIFISAIGFLCMAIISGITVLNDPFL